MKHGTSLKKNKNCLPENELDKTKGDVWDHVAFEAVDKLVISLVVGPRTSQSTEALVSDFYERTNGKLPELVTTDEYKPYKTAFMKTYGTLVPTPLTGERGRPKNPTIQMPDDFVYAMVHKNRSSGKVTDISLKTVFGTEEQIAIAIKNSPVSKNVNTTFVESYNATSRQMNSRKQRKSYTFSKEFEYHEGISWFATVYYNFCRSHITLSKRYGRKTTPAMSARIENHIWTLNELMKFQPIPLKL